MLRPSERILVGFLGALSTRLWAVNRKLRAGIPSRSWLRVNVKLKDAAKRCCVGRLKMIVVRRRYRAQ